MMEANKSQSATQSETIKSRSSNDRIVKPNAGAASSRTVPEAEHFDYKRDPVYQSADPASGAFTGSSPNLGDSFEGFKPSSNDAGPDLSKSDGFGSQFEMPAPGANEQYMGSQPRAPKAPQGKSVMPEAFVDFQTSLHAFQDILQKLKTNLASPEQQELEVLLRQGSELVAANWTQLSSAATHQVSGLKEEIKENPYRGLIGALKIGMAVSQIVASRGKVTPPDESQVAL